jgi:hypothetical protein
VRAAGAEHVMLLKQLKRSELTIAEGRVFFEMKKVNP